LFVASEGSWPVGSSGGLFASEDHGTGLVPGESRQNLACGGHRRVLWCRVRSQRLTLKVCVETTMSCSLPPEILDLIVDHLHDDRITLKACCLVSGLWVPRTRKHLFAHIEFHTSKSHIELWKKTFPDPQDSPAYHTRSLAICGTPVVTAADEGVGGWIRTFHNVVHLQLSRLDRASLVPFHGLSPTVRSLRLSQTTPDVFGLICSFPLLENLALNALEGDADGWNTPSTPPKLTGSLDLRMSGRAHSVTRRLLELPGGLRFSRVNAVFFDEDAESVKDLVSGCSDTLEFLSIVYCPQSAFPSVPVTVPYLTAVRRHTHTWGASA